MPLDRIAEAHAAGMFALLPLEADSLVVIAAVRRRQPERPAVPLGRRSRHGSSSLDAIPVVGRQEQDLVVPPAQNDIEMIEDVAAQDAQVGRGGVGKGGELATNSGWRTNSAGELQRDIDQHELTRASDPLEDQVGWG